MVLGHRDERARDVFGEHAEIGRLGDHVGASLGRRSEHAVEPTLKRRLQPALVALALVSRHAIGVGTREQLAVHGQKRLGVLLQVGVHDADDVAAGVLKTREERGLLPEVAREAHSANVRGAPGRRELGDEPPGTVFAAVVDEDELVVKPGTAENRGRAVEQQREALLLVVAGDDHRQIHVASKLGVLCQRDPVRGPVRVYPLSFYILAG